MSFPLLLVAASFPYLICGCYIWGTDSGTCTLLTYDPIWKRENMPFCFDYVSYPTCIPKFQSMPPTLEFPDGRWFNHSVSQKDAWVKAKALEHISVRIGFERNRTLKNTGRNEYGDPGITTVRFFNNRDCQNAYKSYFCWINFPRCDIVTDTSMPTCRSACENYFHACNYDNDLWRCGPSDFFNGYAPESPSLDPVSGNATYLRDYFPGQPFVGNKFTAGGDEIPICTPALKGSAAARLSLSASSLACLLALVAIIMSVYI